MGLGKGGCGCVEGSEELDESGSESLLSKEEESDASEVNDTGTDNDGEKDMGLQNIFITYYNRLMLSGEISNGVN